MTKVLLYLVSLSSALGLIVAPAQATFPGRPGPIIYLKTSSNESTGGRGGLLAHGPKASQKAVALTDDSGDSAPAVSANGRLIAFARSVPSPGNRSHSAIFVMRSDGSGVRQLTSAVRFDDHDPAFSPDGRTIVFDRMGGGPHIWAMDVDGSDQRQLTRGPNEEWDPVFAPNGRRIVYASNADHDARSDHSDIWAMGAGGSHQRVLVDGVRDEDEPDVSPSGRLIVFSSNRAHGPNLFIARANGRRVRAVTHSKGDCFRGRCYLSPAFSPDGRHIASTAGGRYSVSLTVMKLDGSNRKTFDSGSVEEEGYGSNIVGPLAWGTRRR
jgi:Tol biopolymer transport system component